ncbi:MAG TPA: hypothetical protein VNK43_03275 [Gemmatimonadales bacterium]|nr:hypothetical protein [Gemmatimonadales bacterium]
MPGADQSAPPGTGADAPVQVRSRSPPAAGETVTVTVSATVSLRAMTRAVPTLTPVTIPVPFTAATAASLEIQTTLRGVRTRPSAALVVTMGWRARPTGTPAGLGVTSTGATGAPGPDGPTPSEPPHPRPSSVIRPTLRSGRVHVSPSNPPSSSKALVGSRR